ncbi:Peptidyl-prolyl cis-trans isomerase (rotamase)-cyclophilin family [Nocardioides exalbidus]|uniref:peptidylprolyl isomerase n=1 Tax=Nocardioides exalbidus TaxID=402596 RepID=A0A1H4KA21_9ACTN|nr:peptidylprolyl isomerase [Nocardioides exalbidus]SEB54792.1 Peptidyl-prolyl cis-trans isomerase (rotamase)-cyclophilin family [Nocardioides exalbidus]
MSSNKQRKTRREVEREALQRAQEQQAAVRRRRTVLLSVLSAVVAAVVVVGLVAILTRGGDEQDPAADQGSGEPQAQDTSMLEEEAAGEAQAAAANEAMAAGEVVAEDFTVQPGTAVDSGLKPPRDDRPVACGARAPANARATRPRFPGGPAQVVEPGVDYVARIQTSCGPIVIDLLEDDAPVAVNSFVFLARQGFYDGLEVFRDYGAIAAVEAGSGDNTVGWDAGYRLPDELDLAERKGYPVGTVTTAGLGQPYTAGSGFFIAYGKEFEAGFATNRVQTAFARVLSGMDVIDTMTAMDRLGMGGESFAKRLFMEKVTIEER